MHDDEPYDEAYEGAEQPEHRFDLESLPPVPEAPRTLGPALAGALGLLMLGISGAIATGLALGAPPFDALSAQAMKLGLTPGVTAAAGSVALAVGLATAGLAGLSRRAIDTLDLASDPMPLLERVEARLIRLEDQLAAMNHRSALELRQAVHPVSERLAGLENAVSAAGELVGESDPSTDAIWRLAASMDQIRAQLDQRLEQQLATYEHHLAEELERTSKEHVAALERALLEGREQLEHEVEQVAEEALDDRLDDRGDAAVETGSPTAERGTARAARAVPAAPPAPTAAPEHEPEIESTTPDELGPDSLGVFDQLDDEGKPKAPMPTPRDQRDRRTPVEPMPDIYGGAEQLPDVDSVAGARPRSEPRRAPHPRR